MMSYQWPGNVRELENMVEYLVAMCKSDVITEDLLPDPEIEPSAAPMLEDSSVLRPLREVRDEFVKDYLLKLFRHTRGNVSQAAQIAGYYRADFYKLFQKYDIDPKVFKTSGSRKNGSNTHMDLEL
jgi:two-component system response regulator GlrR